MTNNRFQKGRKLRGDKNKTLVPRDERQAGNRRSKRDKRDAVSPAAGSKFACLGVSATKQQRDKLTIDSPHRQGAGDGFLRSPPHKKKRVYSSSTNY